MAELTPEEHDNINENPLLNLLDIVRPALLDAEGETQHKASLMETSALEPQRPRLFRAAIEKVIAVLMVSDVPILVTSRTGRGNLGSDLLAIRERILKVDVDYKHFRALSQSVIKQETDISIWTAVIALILSLFHSSPPLSLQPSSSFGTPVTRSSASQQGSEQTRRNIEPLVLEEIRDCTHRAVNGFHENFFTGHEWDARVEEVWQRIKVGYSDVDKKWEKLPYAASEDEVCGWFLNLQQGLLPTERAAYFTSSARNKVGTEASRQLDLFVKKRKLEGADTKHDWPEVLVVGELKQTIQKSKGLQIGSAVRNFFAYQPTRFFVHAFTLTGTKLETWVFDRSGLYSGACIDIHEEPKKFVQVVCAYLMMSDEELGLDTFLKTRNNRLFLTAPIGANGTGQKEQLELHPGPIAYQRAIVCRGTSCFLAKAVGKMEFDRVVKFPWTSSLRRPEAELIEANNRGVKGLAQLVDYREEVTSIGKLREGLDFAKPYRFRNEPRSASGTPSWKHTIRGYDVSKGHGKRKASDPSSQPFKKARATSLGAESENAEEVAYSVEETRSTSLVFQDELPYDNRVLRILTISPAGRSISQYKTVLELIEGLRDAIRAHRSLYVDGNILHRDISENNIIITDPEKADGFKGMLIDLDLAKEIDQGRSGAGQRTGTVEFMAIEVLQGLAHTYRHDIESFFYVLIWLCARRGWTLADAPKKPATRTNFSRWHTGSFADIALTKYGSIWEGNGIGLDVLEDFPPAFECVKPLCRAIRNIISLHTGIGFFLRYSARPAKLYDPILQGFDDTIAIIRLASEKAPTSVA